MQAHVTYSPSNSESDIYYESSDTSVASISNDGLISGVGVGQTIITAKDKLSGKEIKKTISIQSNQDNSNTSENSKSSVQIENNSSNYTYIANKNTKVFHYADCPSVKKMNESNKIYSSSSRDELIESGYKSCNKCNP